MADDQIASQINIAQDGLLPSSQSASRQSDRLTETKNSRQVLSLLLSNEELEPKDKFVIWLSVPPAARRPKTQAALAELIGVNAVTLSKWRHSPEVADQVNAASRRYVSGRLSELIAAVFDDAVRGDRHAREMVFKYILGWDERAPVAPAFNDNRTQVFVGGKPAMQLRVGLIVPGDAVPRVGLLQPSNTDEAKT